MQSKEQLLVVVIKEGETQRSGYRRLEPSAAWHHLSEHKGTQTVMANLAEWIRTENLLKNEKREERNIVRTI